MRVSRATDCFRRPASTILKDDTGNFILPTLRTVFDEWENPLIARHPARGQLLDRPGPLRDRRAPAQRQQVRGLDRPAICPGPDGSGFGRLTCRTAFRRNPGCRYSA